MTAPKSVAKPEAHVGPLLTGQVLRQWQQELRRIELEKQKQQQQFGAAGVSFNEQRGGVPISTMLAHRAPTLFPSVLTAPQASFLKLPFQAGASAGAGRAFGAIPQSSTDTGSQPSGIQRSSAPKSMASNLVSIDVTTHIGNNKVCRVECKLIDTVSRVKGQICAQVGVSVNQLRLLFGGKHLTDTRTLLQCHIHDKSELSIVPDNHGIFVKTFEVCVASCQRTDHSRL